MTQASSSGRRPGKVSYTIYRSTDDPKVVTVVSVQQSAERVQGFIDSPDLKERMKQAGIVEMGKMVILKEMGSGVH